MKLWSNRQKKRSWTVFTKKKRSEDADRAADWRIPAEAALAVTSRLRQAILTELSHGHEGEKIILFQKFQQLKTCTNISSHFFGRRYSKVVS